VNRTVAAFQAASAIARFLPEPVVEGMARAGGAGAAQLAAGRRAQVERNLRRIHGPQLGGLALRRKVNETFASYAQYWAESFRLPGTSPEELDARMTLQGWHHVTDAHALGKGVILALPHLGGWEWAGFWVATVAKLPITVVVESLEPRELFEWFADLRQSFGMTIVPLDANAGAAVVRALKANDVVCLLSDRDLGGGGIDVEFFGERTRLPGGPATLAFRTGAALVPCATYFEGRHHQVEVHAPLPIERQGRLRDDIARVTQQLAHELESLIRVAPEQWHLLQPNWPSDRVQEALA
jgi:KDO2-lipid IV(A) lauroyltransferase